VTDDTDYYEVLGVSRDAGPREIKRAWRALARTFHPDLPANSGDDAARRRFAQVQEAYEVLSDVERRRKHDARGRRGVRTWSKAGRAPGARVGDAEDIELSTDTGSGVASIFADLFGMAEDVPRAGGGGAKATSRPRGRPAAGFKVSDLAAGLADAVGMPYEGRGVGEEPAPGTGMDWGGGGGAGGGNGAAEGGDYTSPWDPRRMNAEGFASADDVNASLDFDPGVAPVRGGRVGTGPEPWDPPTDAGRRRPARDRDEEPPSDDLTVPLAVPFVVALQGGKVPLTYRVPAGPKFTVRQLEVPIPARCEDGAQIRLRGCGVPTARGAGDLLLTVAVQEHPMFRLEGNNVVADLPVTPWEAAGGCELDVPTLHGTNRVRVPPGCRSGQRLRLRGLGVDGGHQELVVCIQLPEQIGEEGLELLRRFDLLSGFDPRGGWQR